MKITVVMGFFLPMPPAAGGATEKSWYGLAKQFASRGHEVTVISREWDGWPESEILEGVRHLRIKGSPHTSSLQTNLARDFAWSLRVTRSLPRADVTIINCIALPIWAGWICRRAGRIVILPGRMPKGQYRLYRRIDRFLAVSSPLRDAVLAENPSLAAVTRQIGYPIDWTFLSSGIRAPQTNMITLGYVGRIHREKGLNLLAAAVRELAEDSQLPPWRLLLCGPSAVAAGGSGPEYVAGLQTELGSTLAPDRVEILPPVFDAVALAGIYRRIDVFCYPSCATTGETFGVAVAEAMAAGCVPVVSRLPCFTDFVHDGDNGYSFDHSAPDAASQLARILKALLLDPARRSVVGRKAQSDTRRYDFPEFATRLLEDFSTLM